MSYIKTIVLGGIGSSEVFSTSMTWRNFELFGASMKQEMIESLSRRLVSTILSAAVPQPLKTLMSNAAQLRGWRVEQHDEDERLTNVAESFYAAPMPGTGSPSKTPQDSLVFSLRTSTPGARGRGRMYWPAIGASLGPDFKLTSPTAASVAAAAATLAKLVGDQINAEWSANSMAVTAELAVRSTTDHASRKVERIQVGDVLDTQRRRRDNLPETYVVQPYPLP